MEKVKNITVKPRLRLIRGGRPSRFAMGSVDIVVAPENKPPFRTDAVAYEEDTFLVLSAPVELNEPPEPLVRLLTELREMKPEKPGSVLVKATSPLQLLAVVHDLNQEPSWKEEWVAKALEGIFRETEQRKLHSLALPFLGTRHGSLDKERFLVLLRSTLEGIVTHSLKRIWLMLPPDIDPEMLKVLKFKHRKKKGTRYQESLKSTLPPLSLQIPVRYLISNEQAGPF